METIPHKSGSGFLKKQKKICLYDNDEVENNKIITIDMLYEECKELHQIGKSLGIFR